MSYSVRLSNGKTFAALGTSADYFTSKSEVKAEDFAAGMDRVVISGEPDEGESYPPIPVGTYTDLSVRHIFAADGLWYFCFMQPDYEAIEALRDRADIEYLAMMTGVEL